MDVCALWGPRQRLLADNQLWTADERLSLLTFSSITNNQWAALPVGIESPHPYKITPKLNVLVHLDDSRKSLNVYVCAFSKQKGREWRQFGAPLLWQSRAAEGSASRGETRERDVVPGCQRCKPWWDSDGTVKQCYRGWGRKKGKLVRT